MEIVYRILCLVIGYIFGIFQTAYIYGKLHHIDIRDYGSHNAGTTNVSRVFGKKVGMLTFLLDALKGLFALCLVRALCKNGIIFDLNGFNEAGYIYILTLYTGIGVVLGHNYPFYMGFKGGKGIAASAGIICGMFHWPIFWISTITFFVVTLPSKFVSLGSIMMMSVYFVCTIVFGQMGQLPVSTESGLLVETYLLVAFFSGLAIFKHRANIVRLLNGTENKIFQKKKTLMEQGLVNTSNQEEN